MIATEGVAFFEKREAEIGPDVLRQIERQVMLQLMDQRWRDHLTEMDYLREGINLRAMGQRDPLTEWQREGFDLFSAMMSALTLDYVKYMMHVEVATTAPADAGSNGSANGNGNASATTTAAKGLSGPTVRAEDMTTSKEVVDEPEEAEQAPASRTVVKDEWDKTPRNAPCPCGSGKKFKQCHG